MARALFPAVALVVALSIPAAVEAQTFIGGSTITPSTTLTSVGPFTINQIADGITSDAAPFNGFASGSATGTITLDLNALYDLSGFRLWNDINVLGEGIADFRLDFFGAGLSPLGSSQVFTGPRGQLEPLDYLFATQRGVQRVNLVVLSSNVGAFTRIEIRELGFLSAAPDASVVPEPSSAVLFGSGLLMVAILSARKRGMRAR